MSASLLEPIADRAWRILGQSAWGEEVHTYAALVGGEVLLVDCPRFDPQLRAQLERLGRVSGILLTHAATSAPCAAWQADGVSVWLHEDDRHDRWLAAQPNGWFAHGWSPAPGLTAIHTPGHSAGHSVYLLAGQRPVLFSGDAIYLHLGRILVDMSERGRDRVRDLRYDVLAPYHYGGAREGACALVAPRLGAARGLPNPSVWGPGRSP